jgi:hypothetical protein
VAYVSDTVDDGKRAQAICFAANWGDIGFLIGAAGMGALADWTGMDGWSDANQYLDGVETRQLLNARAKQ